MAGMCLESNHSLVLICEGTPCAVPALCESRLFSTNR